MLYAKKAFTMVELIFVIVIIGVLAAVAVPKFTATRDDAQVSKIAHNIMVGAEEIASYAMSKGKTENDLKVMSHSMISLENSSDAVLSPKKAIIKMGTVLNCLTLEIITGIDDDNLTISLGSAGNDMQCLSLQSLVDASRYPMKLRGKSVQY